MNVSAATRDASQQGETTVRATNLEVAIAAPSQSSMLASAADKLRPVNVITERVLQLRALTESADVQSARAALRRYLRGGEITLMPDGDAYLARAEFVPLALLAHDNKTTPSEANQGGRCQSVVARGGFEPPTFGL
jgi:hypothetical protein